MNKKNEKTKGFTLIELIVVIGIFAIITAIVMANYGQFGSQVLLRNTAYDIALSVREAQVFGLSGRFQESDNFNPVPIIISFDLDAQSDNNPNTHTFYMFRDLNGDGRQTNIAENIKNYDLQRGYVLQSIVADNNTLLQKVFIRFKRPEPDALIYDNDGNIYSDVRLIVQSKKGDKMSVLVESAGQISVQRITGSE